MDRCPTASSIERYAAGEATDEEQGTVAQHLAACRACRAALEAARADDALMHALGTTLRSSTASPPEEPDEEGRPHATPESGSGSGDDSSPLPVVPGYRIDEELYRGGQGIVYRVTDEASGRAYALKLLLRGASASTRELLRFEREIELASRIEHESIVAIRTSGVTGGRPYYVMDLVDGKPLDAYTQDACPEHVERLRLFVRIARAVAVAHRRGVIHRDLKPSNILVDAEARPHLLDFGVAREASDTLAERLRLTSTGEFMGTLAYASPEQVRGDPRGVDTRTDVYALGLILYELLTGTLPYDVDAGISDVVRHITESEPRDPRELSSDERAILLHALEKDPDRRYPSADAIADDVERLLASRPVLAHRPSFGYVARKLVLRHRLAFAAAGVVGVVMLIATTLVLREHLRAEEQARNAALVRDVFRDVLGAAAPGRMGAGVTLLEVYEEAAERIDAELDGAPDAQAALHLTIGDTYRNLMMLAEAEHHLSLALERFRGSEDATDLELARALYLLGLVQCDRNPPEALPLLEEALELRRGHAGATRREIVEAERGLAIGLLAQRGPGVDARVGSLLADARVGFEELYGPDHAEVAETLYWSARLALEEGRRSESHELALSSLTAFERAETADPRVALPLYALMEDAAKEERYDEAEAYLERMVRTTGDVFGGERRPEMLRNFGRLHRDKGDPATCERFHREALVQELTVWGQRRPEEQRRIARLTTSLRDPAGEEPPYADAFRFLRECRGNGAFELSGWANELAGAMREQGRGGAALALVQEALEIRCRAYGEDCPVRSSSLELMSILLVEDGRQHAAIPYLEDLLELAARTGDTESERMRDARARLADCRMGELTSSAEGRLEDAH